MLEQADRLQRQFFGRCAVEGDAGASWEPPVDVFEVADGIEVVVALPGVSPEDVQIHFSDGALSVRAGRAGPANRGSMIRRLEIPYGRFARRLPLPAGRYELTRQVCMNGCLYLTLEKRAGALEQR
jgi:HSP20 family molecular chaperone IbpA